jgi:DUF4097 and DUF4098 domain-containing protein YvlB
VSLNSLAGPVLAHTGTGSIHGQGLSGNLADLGANAGSVSAAFTAPPARITVNTGTGSVTLQVPATTSYAVTASASLGAVTVSVPQAASSGHVIVARTKIGSVTVAGG